MSCAEPTRVLYPLIRAGFVGCQAGAVRHQLEAPGHVAGVQRSANPVALQHGAEQRAIRDICRVDPGLDVPHRIHGIGATAPSPS